MASKYLDQGRQTRRTRYEYEFADRLDGRRILVAGGGGGLGAAVCGRLMQMGADIVLGYVSDRGRAEDIKGALEAQYGGEVYPYRADITSDAGCAVLLDEIDNQAFYGAVICVGDPSRISSAGYTVETVQTALRVNYTGPILLARGCAKVLAANNLVPSFCCPRCRVWRPFRAACFTLGQNPPSSTPRGSLLKNMVVVTIFESM